jgi:predicted transcriptional regulator
MRALLSIRPVHAENIFAGRKKFEFRRKVFARSDVRSVLVYSTRPVGKLVGEFEVAEILQASPSDLWKETHLGAGITERYFFDYFDGCKLAFAIKIGNVRRFRRSINPRDLIADFSPPQSFMYVREGSLESGEFDCRT